MIGVKYGTFNMQDAAAGLRVTSTDVYSSPENQIQADALAEADGALIVKQQYKSKTFTVEGLIRKTTIADLETAIDAFKAAMAVKNQAFDIDYAGGIRRYLASAQNVIIARGDRQTSAPFSVQFLSPDGMGWSLDSTALLSPTGVSISKASNPITVLGTYQCEPFIRVTVNTVTGGTTKTITISNDTSLRGISIQRTWANGDVLEIDSMKKTVYVNNIATPFTGQFPIFAVGAGALGYLDDFTTRDATIEASYTRRWL